LLEIGTRQLGSIAFYPDIDMRTNAGGKPTPYARRDGTPYTGGGRRGP